MKSYVLCGVVLILCLSVTHCTTPSACLSSVEKSRLQSALTSSRPHQNLQSAHYAEQSLAILGGTPADGNALCDLVNKELDVNSLESLFYASSLSKLVKDKLKKDCKVNWGKASETFNTALKDEQATTKTMFYTINGIKNTGGKLDDAEVATGLKAAFDRDDSPLSAGYMFHAASHLSGDLEKFHTIIEDMIPQADETDDSKMHFSGGLHPTALLIDGAYKLGEAAKKAPTIGEGELKKFVKYFLSRKNVFDLQNIAAVVSALHTLTTNSFHIPVAVYLGEQTPVSESSPNIRVRVSNLMCQSLGKISVTADTARHMLDDAVVLSKKPFNPVKGDDTLFEYNFMSVKPARGFYRIYISLSPEGKESRLIGITGAEVEVKVTTQIAVESVEIAAIDKEQSMPISSRMQKVTYPNSLSTALHADDHQKVVMRFVIKDKQKKDSMVVHQCFMKLTNMESKQEIVFVAEADEGAQYKFELDVGAKAKEFGYVSGKYSMEMIAGDAVIENPLNWKLAEVELVFPPAPEKVQKPPTVNFAKKVDINHIFREPEARPSTTVSNLFTALIFLPVLLLFIIWLKLGVNVSNFTFTHGPVIFHGGLTSIFGLYLRYFLEYDMFQTLYYLFAIGVVTFVGGNQMLRAMALNHK